MITLADIIQEILESGAILVVNPTIIDTNPDDFLDHYGHILDTIALVAKGRSGFTFYQSNSAPKDKFNGVFFHSFCTIADNMGIKVNAFIYNHEDNFLSQNADFRIINNEGGVVPSYACPSQEHFSKYIASIALEVAQYPIETLVLDGLMFPSKQTCFCDRCRRIFATKWNVERDFSSDFLESRDLLAEWKESRATYTNQTLREITDSIKKLKNIDIAITVKADKETGFLVGADEYFGQNITELAKVTNNFVIHVNPWNESFPSRGTPEYQQIFSSLEVLKDYSSSGLKYSLYFWNVSSAEKLESVNQMRDDLNAEAIFIEPSLPPDFTKRRTINLGF